MGIRLLSNETIDGNITSTGATITLDSSGSAGYIADRANDTSGATYEYKTNGSLKWYTGLRGVSTEDFYLFNNAQGSTALLFNSSNNNATFAGAVGVGVTGGSNAKLEVVSTSGEVFRADAAGGAFRIVANQTGVSTQGTFSHTGTATFSSNISAPVVQANVLNNQANSANIIYRSGTQTLIGGGSSSQKVLIEDNGATYVQGEIINSMAAPKIQLRPTTQNNASIIELGVLNAGTNAYARIDAINLNNYDTNLRFWTNAAGSTTQVERMRIDSSGNVTIGNATYGSSLGQLRIINDAASSPASLSLFGYNNVADNTDFAIIEFAMQSSGTGGNVLASIKAQSDGTSENAADLRFGTANSSTGLTEKMRITSGGNVGIGTTNPSFKTHIRGGSNTEETVLKLDKSSYGDTGGHTTILGFGNESAGWAKGGIGYERTASYDRGKMHFLQENTGNTDTVTLADSVMTIQPDGDVGIGKTDPSKKLDVLGIGLRLQDTSSYSSITIGASGWNQDYPYQRLDTFNSDGTGYFWALGHRKTDGTKTVRMLISDTSSRYVTVIDQLNIATFTSNELGGSGNYPSFSTNVVLRHSGTSYINGGSVGIGTTSPSYKLDVNGTTRATSSYHQNVNFTNTPTFQIGTDTFSSGFFVYDSTAAAYRMVVKSSTGNVGIGTISPQKTLDVSGTLAISNNTSSYWDFDRNNSNGTLHIADTGTDRLSLTIGGTLTVSGDVVAYGSPSDITLKENIKPIKSALEKVTKLQGVTFDWKESDSLLEIKEDIGFVAQDVQKVLPTLVRKNDNGKLSLRDKGIVPILVEAIKELKAEIEELKKNK